MSAVNGLNNGHLRNGDHHAIADDAGASTSPPSTPADIFQASSVAEIKATLSALHEQEASVTARLDALISSQKDFSRELGRLDLLRANLGAQASTTRAISNGMLSDAASTAKRIFSAVKRLDLEQSRVKATLEVVEQVAELKSCVLGVTGSMGAPQDWETAAGYLHRASKIPPEIVQGSFAGMIVPTAEVPDPPHVTLENSAESLCGLFLREFEKAVQENNGAKITRFFKLFPLIGRSDVGLDVYGRYVCQGVSSRARVNLNAVNESADRSNGFLYANALTKLFEHIAQIVDGHGGLVQRHYGDGKMIRVIERLQVEADVQGGIILDTWSDERRIDRTLTDIRSYAYTFLLNSFLPPTRGAAGTPRANSPANRDGQRDSEDDSVDMKEVDTLLHEITVMLGRWSLYTRFLTDQCKLGDDKDSPDIPDFLVNSSLSRKVSDRLTSPFNTMTTFFFRRSVEKAFQLDEQPPDLHLSPNKPLNPNHPYITSALDDIMFIVNKVMQQTLATSQRSVVESVVPTLGRVLGSDFIGMTQRKMRDESYPKAVIQGGMPPESLIVSFLVLTNNLDVAMDYVKRIVDSHAVMEVEQPAEGAPPTQHVRSLSSLFPLRDDASAVAKILRNFQGSFEAKTSELLGDGIHVVFNNVVKPRLRPILADTFRDIDYLSSEEELAEQARMEGREAASPGDSDLVRRRFQHGWDALTKPLAKILTEHNTDRLLTTTISYLSKVLEKRIWSHHGRINEIGAVRLERDVTGIITAAAGKRGAQHGYGYGAVEAFAKCRQILTVMNMEVEEWEELEGQDRGEIAGRLSEEEMVRARAMVIRG